MNLINGIKTYRWILAIGLFTTLVAAFFSQGYNNHDEHWQILEFANAKLHPEVIQNLPWEYKAQARQTIQPLMVYGLSRFLLATGLYSPFFVTFLLRLVSGMLSFVAVNLLLYSSRNLFTQERYFKVALMLANLLWFMPYIHVRFQGENWAAMSFSFALWFLSKALASSKPLRWFLLSGICCGLAFDFRYQMALALIGLGAWLLVYRKINAAQIFVMLSGIVAMVVLEVCIDRWFYGSWVFTPYNYFYQNQIAGVAASFGVSPWWYYPYQFLIKAIPPLSAVMLVAFVLSMRYFYNTQHTWIAMFFILGHSIIGHKEMRFMLPIVPSFCILLPLFLQTNYWEKRIDRIRQRPAMRFLIGLLLVQNIALLILCMLKPANEMEGFFAKVSSFESRGEVKVFYREKNPYEWSNLHYDFFSSRHVEVIPYDPLKIAAFKRNPSVTVLLAVPSFNAPEDSSASMKPCYKTIPYWLRYVNFSDWISRSHVWSLYEVK